jgi:hypothetical protein
LVNTSKTVASESLADSALACRITEPQTTSRTPLPLDAGLGVALEKGRLAMALNRLRRPTFFEPFRNTP